MRGQPRDTNKNDKNEKKIGRASKKTDADPRIKEFETYWNETFTQETEHPYDFSYEKDGALVKRLLKNHSLDKLKELTLKFFRDSHMRDQVASGRIGFTIGVFFKDVPRLLSQMSMDPLEQARREREQGQTRESVTRTQSKSFKRSPIEQLEDILQEEKRD